MSGASYRRGSQVIREQIDRELKRPKTAIERAFAAGLEQGRSEADTEIAALRKRIDGYRLCMEKLRVYRTAESRRVQAILERLREYREDFRGKGASGQAMAAIIAYKRATEAA